VAHGSSNANAMKNAIRVAAEFSDRGTNARIEAAVGVTRGSRAQHAGVAQIEQ
jgi:fatty acid/phospholipid biosynthesis enzyme